MSTLQQLAVDHPYYCHESNFYSNEPSMRWETMTEFLDEMDDADIDMNLCFRWDIKQRGDSGAAAGRYCAEVFIMHQRKGIFAPHSIKHVNEVEAERFKKYAERHWEVMRALWAPLSGAEAVKTEAVV